ncbi:MAG: hypothetical protein NVS4B7_07990 [Ktedonobacteraceae bacterium]
MSQCGYWKLEADRARSGWLITVTRACTNWADEGSKQCSSWADERQQACCGWAPCSWFCDAFVWIAKWVCKGWYWIAKWICIALANIINLIWLLVTYIVWMGCKVIFPGKKKSDRIKHVFVVMLENRSFDHMLGLSRIKGIDAISGQPVTINGLDNTNDSNPDLNGHMMPATAPAAWSMLHDPGHEFADVKEQISSCEDYPAVKNCGFIRNYSRVKHDNDSMFNPVDIMKCFSPEQLPILTTLAQEFAVCDQWHSSMPGPTWPNRFFIHAASSGGLDGSPSKFTIASSSLVNGFKFDNGTIYDSLDDEDLEWRIYEGDEFPQAFAISGMNFNALRGRFRNFADFNSDVNNPGYSTSYAFIEPNYGHTLTHGGDFKCGNSQHPLDDITRGERLLKNIYETIRNSPHWESSVLIVMYDEHGGFYDHVYPPAAVAPGDSITDPENNQNNFDFKQLGVRVPVVIVSPLIPKGIIDHTLYDHTSVLATVENIFGLQSLTNRDKHANTFKHLFSLASPRTDAPTKLPEVAYSGINVCEDDVAAGRAEADVSSTALAVQTAHITAPVDASLRGFTHVAFLKDLQVSPPEEKEQAMAKYTSIETNRDALQYMHEVRQKINAHKANIGPG